jgi:hypothetical protein
VSLLERAADGSYGVESVNKDFRKLIAIAFVSQAGSYLMTIALSTFVLVKNNSPVEAGLVFVLSYLPSVFVSARLGTWVDKRISRSMLAKNEAIAALASVCCALLIHYDFGIFGVLILLGIRSVLMFISRVALTKWVKVVTPPELQMTRIQVFYLTFFLSTATAGVLAAVALKGSILTVAAIDVGTYLLGICLIAFLKPVSNPETVTEQKTETAGYFSTLGEIFRGPLTLVAFAMVCLSQSLFQGAYTLLVSVLPVRQFGLGVEYVSWFQLAASFGITIGFLINWWWPQIVSDGSSKWSPRAIGIFAVGVILMVLSVSSQSLSMSVLTFFGMNLAYEAIWLFYSSQFFRACPKQATGRYQFVLHASSSFLMACSTLLYSFLIQTNELLSSTAIYALIVLAAFALLGPAGTQWRRNG